MRRMLVLSLLLAVAVTLPSGCGGAKDTGPAQKTPPASRLPRGDK